MREIEIADELGIRRTLAAYCQHLDDGDFGALAHQFTADGSIMFEDRNGATGRAEIEAWFTESYAPERRGRHLTVNSIIDLDGDEATVRSDFAFLGFLNDELRPLYVGRYHDDFVRDEGRWLIRQRTAVFLPPP